MPQQVQVDGVGLLEFSDDFTPDEIASQVDNIFARQEMAKVQGEDKFAKWFGDPTTSIVPKLLLPPEDPRSLRGLLGGENALPSGQFIASAVESGEDIVRGLGAPENLPLAPLLVVPGGAAVRTGVGLVFGAQAGGSAAANLIEGVKQGDPNLLGRGTAEALATTLMVKEGVKEIGVPAAKEVVSRVKSAAQAMRPEIGVKAPIDPVAAPFVQQTARAEAEIEKVSARAERLAEQQRTPPAEEAPPLPQAPEPAPTAPTLPLATTAPGPVAPGAVGDQRRLELIQSIGNARPIPGDMVLAGEEVLLENTHAYDAASKTWLPFLPGQKPISPASTPGAKPQPAIQAAEAALEPRPVEPTGESITTKGAPDAITQGSEQRGGERERVGDAARMEGVGEDRPQPTGERGTGPENRPSSGVQEGGAQPALTAAQKADIQAELEAEVPGFRAEPESSAPVEPRPVEVVGESKPNRIENEPKTQQEAVESLAGRARSSYYDKTERRWNYPPREFIEEAVNRARSLGVKVEHRVPKDQSFAETWRVYDSKGNQALLQRTSDGRTTWQGFQNTPSFSETPEATPKVETTSKGVQNEPGSVELKPKAAKPAAVEPAAAPVEAKPQAVSPTAAQKKAAKAAEKEEVAALNKYVAGMVQSVAPYVKRSIEAGKTAKEAGLDWAREIGTGLVDTSDAVYRKERGGLYSSAYVKGILTSKEGVALNAGEFIKAVDAARTKAVANMKAHMERQRAMTQAGEPPQETGPGIVGMGGAVKSEFEKMLATPTGIKNAQVDIERQSRGLEPIMRPQRMSNPEVWDRVMAKIDQDPGWQDRLIKEVEDNPRNLSADEVLALDHRYVDLQNEYVKATHDLAQIYDDGRLDMLEDGRVRLQMWQEKLNQLEQVARKVGTEWGRAGQMRQRLMNEDYTLANMEARMRASKGGEPLTDAERAQVAKDFERIQNANKALEAELAKAQLRIAELEAKGVIGDILKEPVARGPREKASAADRQADLTAKIKRKVDKGEQLEISSLVQKLARSFVEQGIKERNALVEAVHDVLKDIIPDITIRDTQDAISGYGQYKLLAKDEVSVTLRDIKGQLQNVSKLQDIEARRPPLKTGVERRTPSAEERKLIQQVNEAKRRYGIVVTDPATQLRSALDARKTYYRHQIEDLNAQIASKQRFVKTKTPSPTDAELEALKVKRDALKQEFDEIFGTKQITDAQRIAMSTRAVEKSIAELERRIKERDLFPEKPKGSGVTSPELELLRARREALKAELELLRDAEKPKLSPEEIANRNLKKRLVDNIVKYQQRLVEGDFSPRSRRPLDVQLDDEVISLKADLAKWKNEYEHRLRAQEYRQSSLGKKAYVNVKETLNISRNWLTAWDLSAVFRQGGFLALSHPVRGASSIVPMLRSFASDTVARKIQQQIESRPNSRNGYYERAGMYLSKLDEATLGRQEEAIMSRWSQGAIGKYSGIRMSNRAYITFLNKLRADSFDSMANAFGRTPTPAELKAIGNYINVATGRGNLYKAAGAAEFLATVMFSPRLLASRLELMVGQPMIRGSATTRKMIAKDYGRLVIALGAFYGLGQLAGADLSFDPRSGAFGKLVFSDEQGGKTTVDPLMGFAQIGTLLGRTATGKTVTQKGDVRPLVGKVPYGADDLYDVYGRFARSKFSPWLGSAVSMRLGTDYIGKPTSVKGELVKMARPISTQDVLNFMESQGVARGSAVELLNILGMGSQYWEPR